MKRTFRSVLCILLTVAMLVSVFAVTVSAALPEQLVQPSRFQQLDAISDEIVRAIVVLEGDAVIDLGVAADSKAGLAHEKTLLKMQSSFLHKAGDLEAAYQYTGLFNGVAVDVPVSKLSELEQMKGVETVYIANAYSAPEYHEATEEEIKAYWASVVTGSNAMNSIGYNGDGIVVAVLDTGINLSHEVFQPNDLMKNPALDKATVEATETTGGVYINEKIPYSYDYYDKDTDCTDEDSHGSHVSGIIGGYLEKDGEVLFTGAAPAVQLLGMKIFGTNTGTDTSIYFAALEDAYRLGADVINMSIGRVSGFTYDVDLEDELYGNIYAKLHDAGIAVFCSAGNEANMGDQNTNPSNSFSGKQYVLADYTDYGVLGSPAVYSGNVCVASADNLYTRALGVGFDGENHFYYTDTFAGFELDFRNIFDGKTLELVYLPGVGNPEDYEGLDVEGKLVAVDRGSITFQEKVDNAAAMGAVACIVVNNDPTPLKMGLENVTIPSICVDMSAKAVLQGLDTVTISFSIIEQGVPTALQMSSFSSWGTTPDLQLRPHITGIGGYVYSAVAGSPNAYGIISGTSMSTPNVAGTYAALLQFLREFCPGVSKYELANLAESLLMSTADILVDADGYQYSPRRQGAGLANVVNAVLAPAYISNPTVSLGDDPEMSGVLEMTFEVVSLTDETRYYYLEPTVLTDYPVADEYAVYNSMTSSNIGYDFGYQYLDYQVFTVYEDGKTDTGSTFALEPGASAEVTITVSVNPAVLDWFAQYFTNGFFLEGFVEFYDYEALVAWQLGMGDAPTALFHGSYMSYCGDWTAAPAMEDVDTMDLLNTVAWLQSMGLDPQQNLMLGLAAQGMYMDVNCTQVYFYASASNQVADMGRNPFAPGITYVDPNRNAFSTPLSNGILYHADGFKILPSMLRNCRNLIMTVTDAETNEVYYVDNTEYVFKDRLDEETKQYNPYSSYVWDGTYAHEVNGEIKYDYVPSGTKVIVTFESVLDYPGAQPQLEWSTTFTVDYTAPEVLYHYDAETKQLDLIISDNEYMAAMAVYGDEAVLKNIAYDDHEAGLVYTYTIDLSEYTEDTINVEVGDFATNVTLLAIPLDQGNVSNYPANVEITETEGVYIEVVDGGVLYEDMYVMVAIKDGYCVTDEFALLANGVAAEQVYVEENTYIFAVPVESTDPIQLEVVGVMAHNYVPYTIYEATCCSIGYLEYRCSNCDVLGGDEWLLALGHTPADEYVTITESTCDGQGVSVLYCTDCDAILDIQAADKNGHTAGELVTVHEATCISDGCATRSCTECGVVLEVVSLPAIGHTDGEWAVEQEATCEADGVKSLRCTACNCLIDREVLPAIGHTEGEAVTQLEPSCETKGYATVSCAACGDLLYGTVLEAKGHTEGEAKVVSAPTCEADGYSEIFCTVCDCLIKTTKLDALGHTPGEWTVTEKPSYASAGAEKQFCTVCGEELASRELERVYLPGDMDNNGKINTLDYVLIKRYVMGTLELEEDEIKRADVNGDGSVNIADYTLAKRIALGTYQLP